MHHEGLSGPLPEVDDLTQALALEKTMKQKANSLDREIAKKAEARSVLGATSAPGPVVNTSTLAGFVIAALAVGGLTLSQEEVAAIEVVLAIFIPLIVNVLAGFQARQKVTPVK